ncbi:hypothetical protein KXW42_006950 [Aspergillus fumigatus]|nr:hypothetical protein KXX22_005590 [Aspergillus fumigatus]KAH1405597.1 hypothetical protein KXX51_008858 [Aspergillus fumigatus]KAH1438594.1 hypothetical protein KXX68_006824 [Aspergillus fumigatus]KAH1663222.1 hypothetical protein KXX46_006025 [Aspergillus fumigatus]KAH1785107.1 hypothetical protein KXX36_008289 [Aspergillus fumigatus]
MSLQTKSEIHGQNESIPPEDNGRRKRKREIRDQEEAAYILDDLRSGNRVLYLQEVPRVSHCRAWNCMPRRRTGEPIIRSYYRFALRGGTNLYGGERVEYYHIGCFERIIPDLADLVRDKFLKMDGWIAAPLDRKVTIESSTKAIQDWFRTTTNGREIGASFKSNISSSIQESHLKDAIFVKKRQSLKSRGKWIISPKTHLRFR